MDESRRIRLQKLARGIGDLLDRGVAPDHIRAELIRRAMPPATAAALVARVIEARNQGSRSGPDSTCAAPPARSVSLPPHHIRAAPDAWRSALTSSVSEWARTVVSWVGLSVSQARAVASRARMRVPRLRLVAARARMRVPQAPAFVSNWTARTPASALLSFATIALVLLGSSRLLESISDSRAEGYAETVARLEAEIDATRTEIARFEDELVARSSEADTIAGLRARIAPGPRAYPSAAAYRAAVARYKRQVAAWNSTVTQYSELGQVYTATVAFHNLKLDSLGMAARKLGPHVPASVDGRDMNPKRVRFSSLVPQM